MKRCDTCKYWDNNYDAGIPRAGRCNAVVQTWDSLEFNKDCDLVLKQIHKEKLAFVEDPNNYFYAGFITLPEFSCIQHRNK